MDRSYVLLIVAGISIMGGLGIGYILFSSNQAHSSYPDLPGSMNVTNQTDECISPAYIVPVSNTSMIVQDRYSESLYRISDDGEVSQVLQETDVTPDGYWQIGGIATDQNGNVYISDSGLHRMLKFSPDGRFQKSWGTYGEGEGEFNQPLGTAIMNSSSGEELLYVCDPGNERIQVFSLSGQFIHSISVPAALNRFIRLQKPQKQEKNASEQTTVIPDMGAKPALVERNFDVQSSGDTHPMTFKVNRSVFLGAQKISFDSQDIATENPEEWVPLVSGILRDNTTQTTIRETLEEIRRHSNANKLSEQEKLELIIHTIQQIPLTGNEENKFPVEILHDKQGNTYDKALFLYGLLEEAGYDVVYLAYPGLQHAGVGIGLEHHLLNDAVATYKDSNGDEYIYINPDGPSFIGGINTKYRASDPFVIHLTEPRDNASSIAADHLYSTYIVESIFSLAEKYQFLVNKEKEAGRDEIGKIRENYQKIKSVLDYIEKNPWNTELAYMRIKNSKVNDIMV